MAVYPGTTRPPTNRAYKRLMIHSISISVIYAVAAKTNWLSQDPMLWFCLMLMPTGPPAMKLTALADVNGSKESEKMAIAKFITVCLPLIVVPAVVEAVGVELTVYRACRSPTPSHRLSVSPW